MFVVREISRKVLFRSCAPTRKSAPLCCSRVCASSSALPAATCFIPLPAIPCAQEALQFRRTRTEQRCSSTVEGLFGLSPAGSGSAEPEHPAELQAAPGECTQRRIERKTTFREISTLTLACSFLIGKYSGCCSHLPKDGKLDRLHAAPNGDRWTTVSFTSRAERCHRCTKRNRTAQRGDNTHRHCVAPHRCSTAATTPIIARGDSLTHLHSPPCAPAASLLLSLHLANRLLPCFSFLRFATRVCSLRLPAQ